MNDRVSVHALVGDDPADVFFIKVSRQLFGAGATKVAVVVNQAISVDDGSLGSKPYVSGSVDLIDAAVGGYMF